MFYNLWIFKKFTAGKQPTFPIYNHCLLKSNLEPNKSRKEGSNVQVQVAVTPLLHSQAVLMENRVDEERQVIYILGQPVDDDV
jgi:hypothetical protein